MDEQPITKITSCDHNAFVEVHAVLGLILVSEYNEF